MPYKKHKNKNHTPQHANKNPLEIIANTKTKPKESSGNSYNFFSSLSAPSPIIVADTLKKYFALVVSFYLLALTEADDSDYKSTYFANPSNSTHYKFRLLEETINDWKKISKKALHNCFALHTQKIAGASYELLKVMEEDVERGGIGGDSVDALKFYRKTGDQKDSQFESCIGNIIDSSLDPTEADIVADDIILGVVIGACVLSVCGSFIYFLYHVDACKNRHADEKKPLLDAPSNKKTEDSGSSLPKATENSGSSSLPKAKV